MATAARRRGPKARKARPAATGRTHAISINSTDDNKLSTLRTQYLRERFGLSDPFSELVAALRWEASHAA